MQIVPNVLNTIADLKTFDSNLSPCVSVLGYYAAGDGGGGLYFKTTSPPVPANGGAIIQADDQAYWQLSQHEPVSILQFGAKGDGVTDDTAAVQNFFNYCIAISRRGYVPSRASCYRLRSTITVVGSLYILGDGCVPYVAPQNGPVRTRGQGSWFWFDHSGIGFNLNNVNETTEVTFESIGTFRTQPQPGPGWAPAAAEYDFSCSQQNGDYTFRNIFLLNANKGIYGNGRCTYDNVRGQPLFIGIYSNVCADTNHFRGIHWWPYWSDDASVKTYQLSNTVGLWMNRVDNATIQDCFSLWQRALIQISENANGSTSKLRIVNCDGDSGQYFLYVDSTVVNGASVQLTNCVSQGDPASTNTIGIYIAGKNCRLAIDNYTPSACSANAIRVDGTPNRLTIGNLRVDGWNTNGQGFPAIEAATGNTIRVSKNFDYDGGNGAALEGGGATYISP